MKEKKDLTPVCLYGYAGISPIRSMSWSIVASK